MNGKKSLRIFVLVVMLATNFARISYTINLQTERTIAPPPIEAPATTAREEIVTGMCTFGDCPVATTVAKIETTEELSAVVKETLTTVNLAKLPQNLTNAESAENKGKTETERPETPLTSQNGEKTSQVAYEPVTERHDYGYIGTMWITGYTAEEGFPEGSETASGYGVRQGYCAMNAEQRQSLGIKYGDQIYVEGLGTYTVMDSGCDWGVVDIWCWSNAEAYSITGNRCVYYG